jgi:hypothetical protein
MTASAARRDRGEPFSHGLAALPSLLSSKIAADSPRTSAKASTVFPPSGFADDPPVRRGKPGPNDAVPAPVRPAQTRQSSRCSGLEQRASLTTGGVRHLTSGSAHDGRQKQKATRRLSRNLNARPPENAVNCLSRGARQIDGVALKSFLMNSFVATTRFRRCVTQALLPERRSPGRLSPGIAVPAIICRRVKALGTGARTPDQPS